MNNKVQQIIDAVKKLILQKNSPTANRVLGNNSDLTMGPADTAQEVEYQKKNAGAVDTQIEIARTGVSNKNDEARNGDTDRPRGPK